MKLVHWPLISGLLHLVQQWGDTICDKFEPTDRQRHRISIGCYDFTARNASTRVMIGKSRQIMIKSVNALQHMV